MLEEECIRMFGTISLNDEHDCNVVNMNSLNIHDASENYYEGGIHACRICNNIKFPPYVLKVLKVMLVLPSYASWLLFLQIVYSQNP